MRAASLPIFFRGRHGKRVPAVAASHDCKPPPRPGRPLKSRRSSRLHLMPSCRISRFPATTWWRRGLDRRRMPRGAWPPAINWVIRFPSRARVPQASCCAGRWWPTPIPTCQASSAGPTTRSISTTSRSPPFPNRQVAGCCCWACLLCSVGGVLRGQRWSQPTLEHNLANRVANKTESCRVSPIGQVSRRLPAKLLLFD